MLQELYTCLYKANLSGKCNLYTRFTNNQWHAVLWRFVQRGGINVYFVIHV